MLNKEFSDLERFVGNFPEEDDLLEGLYRIKRHLEESCQLPTTKVKTPAEEPTQEEICPECKGTGSNGWVNVFGVTTKCSTCNGTGKLLLT